MKYSDTAPNCAGVPLKHYKLIPEAFAPEWATEHSCCFDLRACIPAGTTVKIFDPDNKSYTVTLKLREKRK